MIIFIFAWRWEKRIHHLRQARAGDSRKYVRKKNKRKSRGWLLASSLSLPDSIVQEASSSVPCKHVQGNVFSKTTHDSMRQRLWPLWSTCIWWGVFIETWSLRVSLTFAWDYLRTAFWFLLIVLYFITPFIDIHIWPYRHSSASIRAHHVVGFRSCKAVWSTRWESGDYCAVGAQWRKLAISYEHFLHYLPLSQYPSFRSLWRHITDSSCEYAGAYDWY